MKKLFGVFLAVSTLVLSAACASSGASGKQESTDSGDPIVMSRPVQPPPGKESAADSRDGLSASDADTEAGTTR